jgi:hypothetical protein
MSLFVVSLKRGQISGTETLFAGSRSGIQLSGNGYTAK